MPKKKKKSRKKDVFTISRRALRKEILHIFNDHPLRSQNYKQLAKKLGISDQKTKMLITNVLDQLKDNGKLIEEKPGKYKLNVTTNHVTGILELTNQGRGKLYSDVTGEEIMISPSNLNHALHGDQVKVLIFAHRRKQGYEGEVVDILDRGRTKFVGTVEISKSFAFLVPDNKNMPYDIFIPISHLNGVDNGQKAIVEIYEWPSHAKNPVGKVIEILGQPGDHEVEMHAIMAEFDLPYDFPEKVDKAAGKIQAGINEHEIKSRRDFREVTTLTIDPFDAKDFDDALSIQKLDNGHWEVGIHIADVTHYVKTGTLVEKEAYSRGTSVYLVDRVVPMLPEKLSNEICSLRPNEDKLCFSAVFELDHKATVLNEWFGKTVICSDRRFTYEEAQNIIETREGDLYEEILTLNQLAQHLRHKRFIEGSIDFDRVEVKVKVDEKGKPLEVVFKESMESNKLIEEFMLLANKRVAQFIGKPKEGKSPKIFVYRIHDEPDFEKMNSFADFIKKFGYTLNMNSSKDVAVSLNHLLDEVEGKNEQNIIEQLAIRAMAKAVYSTQNIGHYGLSFDYYTHFTSPIRRYPDMMVHRLLEKYLSAGKSANASEYEPRCKHASDKERQAAFAERSSIKYKMVEYMQDKLGHVYDGVISGVTEWGMYVEIVENKIEGMVSLRDMDDDYYVFDEKNFCIVGHNSKNKYQLGDKLKIQIVRANLQKRQLDFMIYDEELYN